MSLPLYRSDAFEPTLACAIWVKSSGMFFVYNRCNRLSPALSLCDSNYKLLFPSLLSIFYIFNYYIQTTTFVKSFFITEDFLVNCKFNCPTFLSIVLVLILGFLPLGGEKFLTVFWQFYAAAISFAVL
jgi:hypothetical protein